MEGNFIKYSDLIKPDQSFDKLIGKLEELKTKYRETAVEISASAKQLANDLKAANSATASGRTAIESATAQSAKYAQTMSELKAAVDNLSRSISDMRTKQSSVTSVTSTQQRGIEALSEEYGKMVIKIKALSATYTALAKEQKKDPLVGGRYLEAISDAVAKTGPLETQLKSYMQTIKSLGGAEEARNSELAMNMAAMEEMRVKVAAYNTEMKANAQISAEAEIASSKEAQARAKLNMAQSQSNEELAKLNLSVREANLLAKYKAELDGHVVDNANLQASSYNQLAAQYGINKIALNKMTAEERANTQAGAELERQTYEIYQQMKALQEQTGKNTLSVGDYNKVWDGLRYQTQQVVRELPSLTISANQFFLAISNNIPLLVDEIRRFKEEGNSTRDAVKKIASSFLSWQTILIVGLTLLSRYGKEIGEFVKSLFAGRKAAYSFAEALRDINKEMSNSKVGDDIAKFQALRKEWGNLKSDMEKSNFLKERKSDIDSLGVSVGNLTAAENLFNDNADLFVKAMLIRAKAIASATVAGQAYQAWVEKSLAGEAIQYDIDRGVVRPLDKLVAGFANASSLFSIGRFIAGKGVTGEDIQAGRLERKKGQASREEEKANRVVTDFQVRLEEQYRNMLKEAGIDILTADTTTGKTTGERMRDLQSYIDNMVLRLKKAHNDILQAIGPDSYSKQLQKINDDYEEKSKELQNIIDKNNRELNNANKKYTADQKKQLMDANSEAAQALSDLASKNAYELRKLNTEHRVNILQIQNAASDLRAEAEDSASEVAFQERLATMKRDMEIEILQNSMLVEEEQQKEYDIRRKWNRKIEELQLDHAKSVRAARLGVQENKAAGAPSDLGARLTADLYASDVAYSDELDSFALLPKEQQTQEAWDAIITKHTANRKKLYSDYFQDLLAQQQAADKAEFDAEAHSEYEITRFTLEQERERLLLLKQLYEQGVLDLNADQLRELLANIDRVGREQREAISDLLKDSVGGTILSALGFSDDSVSQFESFKNQIISQLGEILQAEVEMAEKAIELQQERVDAAQSAYDAEVQARANGYANNVAMAKRELAIQQQTLAKKKANAEKYQKSQLALETAEQASSLATAIANIYQSLTESAGWVGAIIATVASAAMVASFVGSRALAYQTVGANYGDGGLEFLEGGSHASGNDIGLGVRNSRGRQMRAEGGEALAIINKRNTRKYRSVLPDVIDSLNRGTFEQKYASPSRDLVGLAVEQSSQSADLSLLERGVGALVRQNNERVIELQDRTVVYRGNVRRIIKHA